MSVILDTNVFVAAAFNRRSSSARIVDRVRTGQLRMIWNEHTRGETQYILDKIPRLSFASVADLFRDESRYDGPIQIEKFAGITDPDDRKFAALAEATGAVLVTNDDHLLSQRVQTQLEIVTPRQYVERGGPEQRGSDDR